LQAAIKIAIGGNIHKLCGRRSLQKIKSKKTNKQKYQKAAGTRTKQTVIKPNRSADQYCQYMLTLTYREWTLHPAKIFFPENINRHNDYQHQHQRAQDTLG
jgi:hypothetical protein